MKDSRFCVCEGGSRSGLGRERTIDGFEVERAARKGDAGACLPCNGCCWSDVSLLTQSEDRGTVETFPDAGPVLRVFSSSQRIRDGGIGLTSGDAIQHSVSKKLGPLLRIGGALFSPRLACTANNGPSTSCQCFGNVSFLAGLSSAHCLLISFLDLPLTGSSVSSRPSRSTSVSTLVLLFRSTTLAVLAP